MSPIPLGYYPQPILYGHAGSAPITIISRITKQHKTHSLIFLILSAALPARVD
jgi:hypothetical protein